MENRERQMEIEKKRLEQMNDLLYESYGFPYGESVHKRAQRIAGEWEMPQCDACGLRHPTDRACR